MAKITWLTDKLCLSALLTCALAPLSSSAIEQAVAAESSPLESEQQVQTKQDKPSITTDAMSAEIEYYQGDQQTNQIPYFDNRFRIDAQIEEITLMFYRKAGTPPIILVRPDGTKIKISNHDKERIQWYDDRTFDMVKIKAPMPGPWQAIGSIEPNSQIMVVSDVKIEVPPLPPILLSGETIKISGQLFNGERVITTPAFKEAVRLDVDFYSTNNSDFENFGAEPVQVTSFRDDGLGLDEFADDSVFTGEFVLNFASGQWTPIYYIKMPMATRELRQKPIMLHANPISLSVEQGSNEQTPHNVTFSIDDRYVDVDSLIFQGKITYPDRQVEPFSIMHDEGEKLGSTRMVTFDYTEGGIHRINVNAFGKTKNGREFRLVVPEFSFSVEHQETEQFTLEDEQGNPIINEEEISAIEPKESVEDEIARLKEQQLQMLAEQEAQTYTYIAIANGIIIVLALAGFFVWRFRRKK